MSNDEPNIEFEESEFESKLRLESEIEFLQSLTDPRYLHYLSKEGYFLQNEFLNYLKYLRYLLKEPYIKHLRFPTSIAILNILEDEDFRMSMLKESCVQALCDQLDYHWLNFAYDRL
ncbi:mediator complex subunit 31, putative [Babesia microti strain RI]|uniref:Mediator of RNA polymerase II transcription subunit 31 n=1 Tax=Babesia microti (strain RI) TaxID=1133968 RepID=A0A1N6LXI1_BABMR|nr:mediator complex subunit 31, putative [Babesia microti strain RI]SIO73573.1 mediator complex subunit 31, putative [Babesia microti strain RI]|eukprot:XP_021337660.1 mediator complex subunit 31, putative [Babesia microti strain RI]